MSYPPLTDPRWTDFNLSASALDQLAQYRGLLLEWAARMNLVAKSTLDQAEERHLLDSAQVFPYLPEAAETLVDLGSGAGFPGVVLAIMAADKGRPLSLKLIESTGKKCNFLRAVVQRLALSNISVQQARIEGEANPQKVDVVSARALANLDKLLGYAHPFLKETSVCLLMKGENVDQELTDAARRWHMDVTLHPSITEPAARIAEIRNVSFV